MSDAQYIKTAIERAVEVLQAKPSTGRKTKKAAARIVKGLTCEIRSDSWTLTSDMPEAMGGNATGPTPGSFARMGLCCCLATHYAMWFAWHDLPYEDIEVEMEGDLDLSGGFGVDKNAPTGHEELRLQVNIVSSAPQEEIKRVMEKAEALNNTLNLIRKPIPVTRNLKLSQPVEAARAAE